MITFTEYKQRFDVKNKMGKEQPFGVQGEVFDMLNTKERFASIFEDSYGIILFHPILMGISTALMERTIKDKDNELTGRLKAYKDIAEKFKEVILKYRDMEYGSSDRYEKIKPSREEQLVFAESASMKLVNRTLSELGECSEFYEAVSTDMGQELLALILSEKGIVFEELYENKNSNGICTYLDIVELLKGAWKLKIRRYENAATNLRLENLRLNNRRKENAERKR